MFVKIKHLAPFYHRTTSNMASRHPYMEEINKARTKSSKTIFFIRTAREWNPLPASVFPERGRELNFGRELLTWSLNT